MHSSRSSRQQRVSPLVCFSVVCLAIAVVAVAPAAAESFAVGATRVELSAPAGYVSYRQVGDELEAVHQRVPKNYI
jgi:hypothetical protein